jgi:hypothetical protein
MQTTITMAKAQPLIKEVLRAGLVPFVQGSPGAGKSAMGKDIANGWNLEFVDIRPSQMDPTDLLGLPRFVGDKAQHVPFEVFPTEDQEVPEGKNGWLLMVDELSSVTSQLMQAALYKIIQERMIGNRRLHPRCLILAAGNLVTDRAVAVRLSTALNSRVVHFFVDVDIREFTQLAIEKNFHKSVIGYVNFRPQHLVDFQPDKLDTGSFPCPRTWEMASRFLTSTKLDVHTAIPVLCGILGTGAGREFAAYLQEEENLIPFEKIMDNPKNIAIPEAKSTQYALAMMVAYQVTEKNMAKVMQFLTRMFIDLQVIAIRVMLRRNPQLQSHNSLDQWLLENGRELQ